MSDIILAPLYALLPKGVADYLAGAFAFLSGLALLRYAAICAWRWVCDTAAALALRFARAHPLAARMASNTWDRTAPLLYILAGKAVIILVVSGLFHGVVGLLCHLMPHS